MVMSILADECINRDIIAALEEKGISLITVAEANLVSASDTTIFDYAFRHNLTLLTFDKDFGNILRFDIKDSFGVVVVYIEDMTKGEIIQRTLEFFQKITPEQIKGHLFIIEKDKIRMWPK